MKRLLLLGLALYIAAWGLRIVGRKYYIWLPDYVRWSREKPETPVRPIHVFFFYTDHFEPALYWNRMQRWEQDYPRLARRHRDSAGRPLQHTWFYPADDPVDANMEALQRLVAAGYGEVEFHLHHLDDTEETARQKYREGIAYFQRFGFLQSVDGKTQFAFAHGNAGLDNSLGPHWCGVNRELALLREFGCFADFGFPAIWAASQPSIVNTIFEATDDDRPKSYDRGEPLRLGRPPGGDLLIFPGPLVFGATWDPRKLFVFVENTDIHPTVPVTERRVDLWMKANIHVQGRPDWVFVKVQGHAASSDAEVEETLGPRFDRALTYLETRYNDGTNYVLHYVTAREAYNLARAAAAGKRGNPGDYFNFVIPPYRASPVRP